jgi:hypothetical protein
LITTPQSSTDHGDVGPVGIGGHRVDIAHGVEAGLEASRGHEVAVAEVRHASEPVQPDRGPGAACLEAALRLGEVGRVGSQRQGGDLLQAALQRRGGVRDGAQLRGSAPGGEGAGPLGAQLGVALDDADA